MDIIMLSVVKLKHPGQQNCIYNAEMQLSGNLGSVYDSIETLRFLCLNERNISLVAICAVI